MAVFFLASGGRRGRRVGGRAGGGKGRRRGGEVNNGRTDYMYTVVTFELFIFLCGRRSLGFVDRDLDGGVRGVGLGTESTAVLL